MADHSARIAGLIEEKSRELVAFFAGLDEVGLRSPCADPNGATVGAVLDHLHEGYDLALGWLRLAAADALPAGPPSGALRSPGTATGGDGHPHHHDNDHPGVDAAVAVESLRRGGETWAELVRGFTPEQLALVPPATPGITDGSKPLGDVVTDLLDHQMAHLGYAQRAVGERVESARQRR